MKKLFIGSLLLTGILLTACEDLLEKEPIHQLNASTFFTSENDLKIYSHSFYVNDLPSADDIAKEDGTSDYAAINAPGTFLSGKWGAVEQGGWGISNWSALRNINYFLEKAANTPVSPEVLNHYMGLARYWRAVFYFQKVQTFGAVPWYDKALNPDDPELNKPRDSREFIMGKVLEDINFATTHMRETKDTYSSLVNRFTALAMKSRICLFEGTYRKYHTGLGLTDANTWLQESANAAKEVIDSKQYQLYNTGKPESDYRTLFISEDMSGMPKIAGEVILARLMNTESRVWHDLTWNFNSQTNGSRWSLLRPFVNTYLMRDGSRFTEKTGFETMEFYNEMKNRDYRLSQTIRTEGYFRKSGTIAPPDFAVTLTGYHVMKWSLDDSWHDGQGQCTNNIPIIRYAEVLLNYAEAKAELGQFGSAEWDMTIRPLRSRAGVSGAEPVNADPYLQTTFFTGISNKYLLEIRRERGIELCFEGQRYQDLMRWKLGDLLSSEKSPWLGIYIPAKNVNYDLNGDGKADVCIVDKLPGTTTPGVKYVILGANIRLSEGTSGYLNWASGINRSWDDKKYLRPVPQSAITLNPELLPQNPGWE